ncbi:N-carbamoyl-D-amino acid hydrolase [Meiothermus luteus]|jgi:N-carbamoylputrescine amidase|uniref:N-carbamoyl-D-amino acid hydrolase n=1 Tax=Meiothermus luteus TaxID=2026184 RepID=A0A399ETL8_9DEIN|nr:N-carbamoylputrescine amidase [Meiothermus luteus]RIH85932.1 N-carbamoyl-D-amino acid hydrolase [Meiothermus luteus]RMH54597.1 MAG: N-carbamoylputrescine amidase [Deinococcota bacterium]
MTRLAVVQMSMGPEREANLAKALRMVREAAALGAQVVLLPELFESLYFCQAEREHYFALAHPVEGHPFLPRFQQLAQELGLVLPVSFFERAGQAYYNSLAMIGPDGRIAGVYRKSHIPDGPGYEEKYYFNPGDTGFLAFPTPYGTVGAGICWDQWYPECARSLVLLGAEVLLYPTAIGSEPPEAGGMDTKEMWQRVMIGHAVANLCYLAAANRVGTEEVEGRTQTYYGSSFIADYMGNKLAEAGRQEETILVAELNLEEARRFRAGFGFFRDRRPDLYGPLLTLDGRTRRL